jgi:hypothetical protein
MSRNRFVTRRSRRHFHRGVGPDRRLRGRRCRYESLELRLLLSADLDLVLGSNDPMIEPLLGIVDEVNISLDWEFDIAFGVFEISDTMESILFVDTSATNELTIDNLRVDLTGGGDGTFAAKGKAGVFGALFHQDEINS